MKIVGQGWKLDKSCKVPPLLLWSHGPSGRMQQDNITGYSPSKVGMAFPFPVYRNRVTRRSMPLTITAMKRRERKAGPQIHF